VHRDGIHFQGLRYLDPTLAAYVGEAVTIRFDPRDLGEVRVFHHNRFLCRAVSPEHAGQEITLKDIQAARTERRRRLRGQLRERIAPLVDRHADSYVEPMVPPAAPALRRRPTLRTYREDRRS
jgi:putative transposase